jgi:hypothetical protein
MKANGTQAPERVGIVSRKNMGSSIDDFLKEEGIFEEAQTQAVKEVVSWRLAKTTKKKISKSKMQSRPKPIRGKS